MLRFALTWDQGWWILGNLILGLMMQPVLIVIAAKALLSVPAVPNGVFKLLGSLAYGFLFFGLFWSVYSPVPRNIRDNEHFAMSFLNDCAVSAYLDAFEHSGLYPLNFVSLAPKENPKCLATGPWVVNPSNPTHGYFFEYVGSISSSTAQGCTRFKSFRMTARPVVFGRTGIRSFLVDERMSIHTTSENRPANTHDRLIRLCSLSTGQIDDALFSLNTETAIRTRVRLPGVTPESKRRSTKRPKLSHLGGFPSLIFSTRTPTRDSFG